MGLNSDPKEDDWAEASASGVPDVDQQAIDWVVRLTSGKATAEDRAEFERWRAQSPQHEAAAAAARQLWVGVGQSLSRSKARTPVKASGERRFVARPRVLAIAASLLLAVVLGFQALHSWRYDHVAAAGEQDSFRLTDGTMVTLNSGSALDVEFSSSSRHVTLARGEAFFDVTHNPAVPFIVAAGEGQVRVLGTAFAVRRDDDGVVVTVERGKVEVRSGGRFTLLTRDQRVHIRHGELEEVEVANPHTQLAWRRGRLIIEDQPLHEVVHELNRYYPGMIVVRGESIGSRRLNAVIDLKHIDQWLAALDESQPIEIGRYGPVTILRAPE